MQDFRLEEPGSRLAMSASVRISSLAIAPLVASTAILGVPPLQPQVTYTCGLSLESPHRSTGSESAYPGNVLAKGWAWCSQSVTVTITTALYRRPAGTSGSGSLVASSGTSKGVGTTNVRYYVPAGAPPPCISNSEYKAIASIGALDTAETPWVPVTCQ